jgi:hypothetical protein
VLRRSLSLSALTTPTSALQPGAELALRSAREPVAAKRIASLAMASDYTLGRGAEQAPSSTGSLTHDPGPDLELPGFVTDRVPFRYPGVSDKTEMKGSGLDESGEGRRA